MIECTFQPLFALLKDSLLKNTFQPQFALLKDSLLKKIVIPNENSSGIVESPQYSIQLRLLLLLITAIFNTELLTILQSIIRIRINSSMYLLSGREAM